MYSLFQLRIYFLNLIIFYRWIIFYNMVSLRKAFNENKSSQHKEKQSMQGKTNVLGLQVVATLVTVLASVKNTEIMLECLCECVCMYSSAHNHSE